MTNSFITTDDKGNVIIDTTISVATAKQSIADGAQIAYAGIVDDAINLLIAELGPEETCLSHVKRRIEELKEIAKINPDYAVGGCIALAKSIQGEFFSKTASKIDGMAYRAYWSARGTVGQFGEPL